MMRLSLGAALALALAGGMAQAALAMPVAQPAAGSVDAEALHRVGYYCSPGFEASYGGTCVAIPPRFEIRQFIDQPIYGTEVVREVHRYRRRHRGLRELY